MSSSEVNRLNMKVLLINQYAGNKGDRAVLYAMCNMLIRNYPDCQIVVSTSSPELWQDYPFYEKNCIRFIPSAWDYVRIKPRGLYWKLLNALKKYTFTILRETTLRRINICKFISNPEFYKAVKEADGVISVGGHHFTTILSRDLVSSINFDASIAVTLNKLICFSQSFGPFNFYNKRNRLFTTSILGQCLLLCPRENSSTEELKNLHLGKVQIHRTFETVISLNKEFSEYVAIENRPCKIGIAIYCTQYRSPTERLQYIKTISDFSEFVIHRGYGVVFFPMELKNSAPDDRPMIHEIIGQISTKNAVEIIDEDLQTLDHLRRIEDCRLFVGHKTHSTIFALTTGTPLIGIAYHPKTIEFMRMYGVEKYAIDDKILSFDLLKEKFLQIEPLLSEIGVHCNTMSRKFADKIEQDFLYAIGLFQK